MRLAVAVLLAGTGACWCQLRDVVKSAEIDRMFARAAPSLAVLTKNNYAVEFRVSAAGARGTDGDADEFWFARRGSATVKLGERSHAVSAGDVVRVNRGTPYSIGAGGRFEYVAVKIFATERRMRIGIGAAPEPHPMAEVAGKAQIDRTLATADKNTLLHSAGALLINHVIYKAAPGPHEVHATCDDLYFVRMGTARAWLDGTLAGGKEDQPGEIRGTGVTGAREFSIAPGDMVSIPRNTAHYMEPGGARLGYLLVKVCE